MAASPGESGEILDLKGKKRLAVVKWVSKAGDSLGEKPPLQAVLADKPGCQSQGLRVAGSMWSYGLQVLKK